MIQHNFYPRSPCGERLLGNVVAGLLMLFLSTLSLRRATGGKIHNPGEILISIHALLAESDSPAPKASSTCLIFLSTLSLRRATDDHTTTNTSTTFLSTLSLRRATGGPGGQNAVILYFYPRSPCGERPKEALQKVKEVEFLSTLSLRRATKSPANSGPCIRYFYPRSPCGERPLRVELV